MWDLGAPALTKTSDRIGTGGSGIPLEGGDEEERFFTQLIINHGFIII